jgi:hypothetical protein
MASRNCREWRWTQARSFGGCHSIHLSYGQLSADLNLDGYVRLGHDYVDSSGWVIAGPTLTAVDVRAVIGFAPASTGGGCAPSRGASSGSMRNQARREHPTARRGIVTQEFNVPTCDGCSGNAQDSPRTAG